MPLFMDVHHNIPEGADAAAVAGAHEADLEIQGKYHTRYLNYWLDVEAGKIFCLVEAPTSDAAVAVHREAHGLLADSIYEVVEGS